MLTALHIHSLRSKVQVNNVWNIPQFRGNVRVLTSKVVSQWHCLCYVGMAKSRAIYLSVGVFVCSSILSINLSVCLSVYLPPSLPASLHYLTIPTYLSIHNTNNATGGKHPTLDVKTPTFPLNCGDIQNVIDLHLRPQTVYMQGC